MSTRARTIIRATSWHSPPAADEERLQRFTLEAQPADALDYPNMPVVHDVGNAIFDATGVRIRQVLFTPERVKAALAARPA